MQEINAEYKEKIMLYIDICAWTDKLRRKTPNIHSIVEPNKEAESKVKLKQEGKTKNTHLQGQGTKKKNLKCSNENVTRLHSI